MADFKTFNRQRIETLLTEYSSLIGAGKLKQAAFRLAEIVHRLIAHAEASAFVMPGMPSTTPSDAELRDSFALQEIEQKVGQFIKPEKPVLLRADGDVSNTELMVAKIEALEKKLEELTRRIPSQTTDKVSDLVADKRQTDLESAIVHGILERKFASVGNVNLRYSPQGDGKYEGTALIDGAPREFSIVGDTVYLIDEAPEVGAHVSYIGAPSAVDEEEVEVFVAEDVVDEIVASIVDEAIDADATTAEAEKPKPHRSPKRKLKVD